MQFKQSLMRRVLPALIAEACALYASQTLAAQPAQPAQAPASAPHVPLAQNATASDGIVASVERFDVAGGNIAMLFGARKPDQSEREDWRAAVQHLARIERAAEGVTA